MLKPSWPFGVVRALKQLFQYSNSYLTEQLSLLVAYVSSDIYILPKWLWINILSTTAMMLIKTLNNVCVGYCPGYRLCDTGPWRVHSRERWKGHSSPGLFCVHWVTEQKVEIPLRLPLVNGAIHEFTFPHNDTSILSLDSLSVSTIKA